MKTKNLLSILSALIFSFNLFPQSMQKWSVNGNTASTGDFVGTSNNESLVLKANNTIGLKIKPNGELIFKSLDLNAIAPKGLVITSGEGLISRFDFNGNPNQFLSGNGSWQNLPRGNWLSTGNDVFWTAGNVGIGIAPSPIFKLDVVGDARISNNLYVGGGIIITDKVQAATQIKGFDFKVDHDLSVDGASKFNGSVQLAGLAGSGNRSLIIGPSGVIGAGPIIPLSSGNSCIPNADQWSIGGDNILPLSSSLYPDKSIGTCDVADFILKSNNVQRIWVKQDGKIGINNPTPFAAFEIIPDQSGNYNISTPLLRVSSIGATQVNGKGGLEIFTSTLNSGKPFSVKSEDDNNGILTEILSTDIEGNTVVSSYNTTVANPAFTVKGIDLTADAQDRLGTTFKIYGNQNGDVSSSRDMSLYYKGSSGGNFFIYDGVPTDGAYNGLGANASLKFSINGSLTNMSSAVEIGNPNLYGNTGSNSTLKINSVVNSKAITVFSKTGSIIASKESFIVYADGKTQIGIDKVASGPHTDAMLSVGGNGKIACKEVRVFNNTSGYWADFVFEKNYELMSLADVEKYYKTNKHLPNIPTSKQIEENGNELAKTDALLLQKIEELTLYIVQQQKEIDELKKKEYKKIKFSLFNR